MSSQTIQLSANFGVSHTSIAASWIYYTIESGTSTVRQARSNAGVRADGNGCYSADVAIDDSWHPCRVIWDNGGAGNTPTRSTSGAIESPASTAVQLTAAEAAIIAAVGAIDVSGGGLTDDQASQLAAATRDAAAARKIAESK